MNSIELNSLTLEESKEYMVDIGEKAFRGEQLFLFFNRNNELNIDDLKILPKKLRSHLIDNGKVNKMEIYKRFDSKIDNTKKYLYLLEDGNIIESVAMEYTHGLSACISTQVGCKMGCSFCASTKEGLIRNLTPAEMVNQIYMMEKDLGRSITNIVLMGSGEPLDNYDNTLKFLNIINDERGHNISLRNITLSTCGVVPKIYDLAKSKMPITLSISLHSPFDLDRKDIMPIANRYSVRELMDACRYYAKATNRRITFEYTLIDNVNDREKDVRELVNILKGINAHVNLIPLNPIKEFEKDRPSRENIERFQNELKKFNINATIRREMGGDISASCGQLRRSITDKNPVNIRSWGDKMMVGAKSDIGKKREVNEDDFYASDDIGLPLYLVADGMGGHNAGEVASKMAIDIIKNNIIDLKKTLADEDKIIQLIKKSIEEANTKIYLKSIKNQQYKGMGTTITLAYILEGKICLGHVGDSRAYLIQDGNLNQITEDHSFVNELLKSGSITKEEAKNHPKRNMITRAVGSSSIIEMDLKVENYNKNDILILCSDGLINMVRDSEILEVFKSETDVQKACDILVDLANSNGGLDNITIVAIKLD